MNSKTKDGSMRRVLAVVPALVILLVGIWTPLVRAAACPTGMSQLDCSALYGNWSNWIPSTGSSCSDLGSVTPGNLPSGVPEPYNGLITKASAKFGSSASLEAAILYWENRGFPPINKQWATSSAGAQGPMQFLLTTFDAYGQDGNGDGKIDINNIADAIYTGANLLAKNGAKADTPLGSLDQPLAANTLLRAAAAYNAGGGNVDKWGSNATLDSMFKETADYVRAVYALISSNFTSAVTSGSNPVQSSSSGSAGTVDTSVSSCGNTDIGTGTGQFTDDTSVTIPGVQAMLIKAKSLADPANRDKLQGLCDGNPNCYQKCDRLAAVAWGHTSSNFPSAKAHWLAAVAAGKAHPNDRKPPVGALLFYDTSTWGHVATYLGNNQVLSNDVNDSESGFQGGVYIVSADKMETTGWHLKYLGWVNPVPWL